MNYIIALIITVLVNSFAAAEEVRVGSKVFTENYILAEIVSQTIESSSDLDVDRKFGLGGTGIVYQALKNGEIDLYVEYAGTIGTAILKSEVKQSVKSIGEKLHEQGIYTSGSMGINNTYAIAVHRNIAEKYNLKTVSDLVKLPETTIWGMSYEFLERNDGYYNLLKAYGLVFTNKPFVMEHNLAFEAIQNKKVDIIEVYSTDAKIQKYDLVVLEDNKSYFPSYEALILARKSWVEEHQDLWSEIKRRLEGKLNNKQMIRLNAYVDFSEKTIPQTASEVTGVEPKERSLNLALYQRTYEHLRLVVISLLMALALGIPLGVLATRNLYLEKIVLTLSGVIQTIPSLALLCFLIPVFGIGEVPAIIALFLYGLLPIVINTHTGIISIEKRYQEAAVAIGLTEWQRLISVELPLASPYIWSGITTSAIISIGTATLAALIGAGGYGTDIVTGLALNNNFIILKGAIPAAVLAIITQISLKYLGRWVIPKGLQKTQ